MTTFVTILGWLCILFICISILCGAIGFAAMFVGKALERFEWAIAGKTRHEVGRSISASAHWFSESDDAWRALKILGDRLTRGMGAADPNEWREEWRRQRAAKAKQPADDPLAAVRWICSLCTTVNGINSETCVGCHKGSRPTAETTATARPPIKDDPQCPVCRGPDGGHYVGCMIAPGAPNAP